ncbi:DUF3576 domain-containing protein [Ruegeria sp. 2205SS24-7]|uniref:DUF3576 domain-containing protein n=1 Tax=Ruegeria discodermiae TaxID=3064389 RepID=UPI002741646E|nr:DUF3576 domain-containing protein [Ruegeria sp. 2205SS24-7]MDP5218263.1 DUF3576 domain-containing protein [Ruegeria sp. 2205SS24-7]
MTSGPFRFAVLGASLLALASCGGPSALDSNTSSNDRFVGGDPDDVALNDPNRSTIWDVFKPANTENIVDVNKYLWAASLDVLNFLPVEAVDPFTGVISTGYGTPPGGGRAYRATVHISDPALDARSLNVALQTRNGPVSQATARAVEDAILSRARQLRVADGRL